MNKQCRKPSESFLQKLLLDPEVRIQFEVERARTELAATVRTLRKKAGLTQAQLALRIDTAQSVIARLEGGMDRRIPSLPLLAKIADACHGDLELRVRFPKAA